jgi:hypothetical protein
MGLILYQIQYIHITSRNTSTPQVIKRVEVEWADTVHLSDLASIGHNKRDGGMLPSCSAP